MESRTAGKRIRSVQSDYQQNYKLQERKPQIPAIVENDTGYRLALKLSREQRKELFDTAFPEFRVWEEAAEQGYTVDETNDILYEKGLPLLTTER